MTLTVHRRKRPTKSLEIDPFLRAERRRERSEALANTSLSVAPACRVRLEADTLTACGIEPRTRQGVSDQLTRCLQLLVEKHRDRLANFRAPMWKRLEDAADSVNYKRPGAARSIVEAADVLQRESVDVEIMVRVISAYLGMQRMEEEGGPPDDDWFKIEYEEVAVSHLL